MPDERSHQPWVIDPDTMLAMRLKKGREALARGEASMALVEAEELLDERPDHADALVLSGEAALVLRDAALARATLEQALHLKPADAVVLDLLTVARFECADWTGTLEAARAALAKDARLSRPWYYQGLTLERSGDGAEALRCFERAHAMDADAWPLPRNFSDAAWEDGLARGRKLLPGPIRGFYAKVPIIWEKFPDDKEIREAVPPLSPLSYALFEGQPPLDGDPWTEGPKSIRLFRGNLRHGAATVEDLGKRLADALLQEAAAWLGILGEEAI